MNINEWSNQVASGYDLFVGRIECNWARDKWAAIEPDGTTWLYESEEEALAHFDW